MSPKRFTNAIFRPSASGGNAADPAGGGRQPPATRLRAPVRVSAALESETVPILFGTGLAPRPPIHLAIICCLPIALHTGAKPTLRTYEMLCHHLSGLATADELAAHVAGLKNQPG